MGVLTVACAYRPGNGFTDEYVYRLKEGVQRFCEAEHRFVCMTRSKLDQVETIEPTGNNRGWWTKLHLFSAFTGPTVYLDLDTVLIDDVTDIFTYPHRFTAGCNWKYFRKGQRIMNSAFMAWDGETDLSYLDQPIDRTTELEYSQSYEKWGDQGWIQDNLKQPFDDIHELFPGRFVSYKIHIRRQNKIPDGASIVAFHGRPRPHEIAWKLIA